MHFARARSVAHGCAPQAPGAHVGWRNKKLCRRSAESVRENHEFLLPLELHPGNYKNSFCTLNYMKSNSCISLKAAQNGQLWPGFHKPADSCYHSRGQPLFLLNFEGPLSSSSEAAESIITSRPAPSISCHPPAPLPCSLL